MEKGTINDVSRRIYRSLIVSNFPNKERDITGFMDQISVEHARGLNMNLLPRQLGCSTVLQDLGTQTKRVCARETLTCRKPYTCKCYRANNFKHYACEVHELISLICLIPAYWYQGSKASYATHITIYTFFSHLNF